MPEVSGGDDRTAKLYPMILPSASFVPALPSVAVAIAYAVPAVAAARIRAAVARAWLVLGWLLHALVLGWGLLGGTPEEVPDRFAASSPLTYVDDVKAPVYISAGVNDPRCPIRQIDNYVARLAARSAPHEVYRYDAGHGSLVVDERIKQLRLEMEFAESHLTPAAATPTD